jgi:hypothetical protein
MECVNRALTVFAAKGKSRASSINIEHGKLHLSPSLANARD